MVGSRVTEPPYGQLSTCAAARSRPSASKTGLAAARTWSFGSGSGSGTGEASTGVGGGATVDVVPPPEPAEPGLERALPASGALPAPAGSGLTAGFGGGGASDVTVPDETVPEETVPEETVPGTATAQATRSPLATGVSAAQGLHHQL